MLRPVRITPPAALPISLQDALEHLRIEPGIEDFLVQNSIAAATDYLDGFDGILGRCLVDQVWRQDFYAWDYLRLPFPDIKDVSVVWRDDAGLPTTVSASDYWLDASSSGSALLFRSGWASPNLPTDSAPPVSVTFTAGYGAAADVPGSIKQAILLLVGHSYRYREAVTDEGVTILPLAFHARIAPYRVVL